MFNIIKIVKEKKFNDETIRLIKEMGLLDENEEQKKSLCNKIISIHISQKKQQIK